MYVSPKLIVLAMSKHHAAKRILHWSDTESFMFEYLYNSGVGPKIEKIGSMMKACFPRIARDYGNSSVLFGRMATLKKNPKCNARFAPHERGHGHPLLGEAQKDELRVIWNERISHQRNRILARKLVKSQIVGSKQMLRASGSCSGRLWRNISC